MSIREMAVELVSSLTDEQVEHLIEFVKGFTGGTAVNSVKSDRISEEKTSEEKLKAFEELDKIVRKNSHLIAADNFEDDLAAHRREKYGS